MIILQAHSDKSYGVSTTIFPAPNIRKGNLSSNTTVTCTSHNGYVSNLTFNITSAGVYKQIGIASNNQYFVPSYSLYYR